MPLYEEKNTSFVSLEKLHEQEFIDFIIWYCKQESRKKVNRTNETTISWDTVINLFSYINSFYTSMYEKSEFRLNPFINFNINSIRDKLGDYLKKNEDRICITDEFINEGVQKAFDNLHHSREHLRNKLILTLFLYGLSRREIALLTVDAVNRQKISVNSNDTIRELPMTLSIFELITEYLTLRKEQKIKSNWLICKSDGERLSEQQLSVIFNELLKEVGSNLTIEKIQQYLVKSYLIQSRDIYSVLYVTDLEITSLAKLITKKDVQLIGKGNNKILRGHPFRHIIDTGHS